MNFDHILLEILETDLILGEGKCERDECKFKILEETKILMDLPRVEEGECREFKNFNTTDIMGNKYHAYTWVCRDASGEYWLKVWAIGEN